MAELLPTIAAYVPPHIVRAALTDPAPVPPTGLAAERFPAAVLFADVMGFSHLTEALAQRGAEGPEELTRLLNRYFSWMIAFIEVEGGEVIKFGGDSLTAIFPATTANLGQAVRRAMQAAETMQSVMDEFNIMESSAGVFSLVMKIGLGAGEVLAARVGGYANHWEYIIADAPLDQATQAQHRARPGQIALSHAAKAIIASASLYSPAVWRPDWTAVSHPEAVESVLRCYAPQPVLAWLDQELHSWLATLRPMSVLFVGVHGLDYAQADVVDRLHTFTQSAQRIIEHYQGNLPRLTVDDKGTVLLILFGAPPQAHEDDPERALRCALDLQGLARQQNLQLAIGVTTGHVFAGPVGSDTRREYTVMGDTVNLAARLMVVIGPGQICCTYETYRGARNQLSFTPLPPVPVKGKTGLVRLYQPTGHRRPIGQTDQLSLTRSGAAPAGSTLVGRQAELARLTSCLDEVRAGRSHIVVLEGEAGIGKSRLLQAMVQRLTGTGLTPLVGRGRSIEPDTPYHAWQDILSMYFGLENNDAAASGNVVARRLRLQAHINEVAPELAGDLPLLNDILPLDFPAHHQAAHLTPAARHENLAALLVGLLRAWAVTQPLVLILEDAHWLDSYSWAALAHVAQTLAVEHLPLFLIIAMRPLSSEAAPAAWLKLTSMAETEHLHLGALPAEETLTLAAARLGLTGHELSEVAADLVQRRAGGNPFFAEELIYTLHDSGFITLKTFLSTDGTTGKTRCLVSGDPEKAAQVLPATIQSVILSQLDRLPPAEQLILKIAAVIGDPFTCVTLRDIVREHLDLDDHTFQSRLYDLTYLDLIQPAAPEPIPTYRFKNAITHEVTYQSLLFNQRRQLHRSVAHWYEQTYVHNDATQSSLFHQTDTSPLTVAPRLVPAPASTSLSFYYPLLAYHWRQAGDEEREQHYTTLVGEQAAGQFADTAALAYLNRALELTPESNLATRCRLLLARETVYHRRGDRPAQAQDLFALTALTQHLADVHRQAEVALRQARYAEATGDYPASLSAAQQVVEGARSTADTALEFDGYIAWGAALTPQGDYPAAREKFTQVLTLARNIQNRCGEAESLYHLGFVDTLQGDYAAAQAACQDISGCTEANRVIEANNYTLRGVIQAQLGDTAAARDCFEQALRRYYASNYRRGEVRAFYPIGRL